jgi:hypothetical protein
VESGAHQSERLVQVFLPVITLVPSAELNTFGEKASDMESTCHDVDVLIGDVILHACLFINGQLDALVDRPSQATVILTSILVVGVVLGVVNVVCEVR